MQYIPWIARLSNIHSAEESRINSNDDMRPKRFTASNAADNLF